MKKFKLINRKKFQYFLFIKSKKQFRNIYIYIIYNLNFNNIFFLKTFISFLKVNEIYINFLL